ncbi:MAG: LuxR C-terminal-related transcriptional regulator [Solirubrobacterales bacterium]
MKVNYLNNKCKFSIPKSKNKIVDRLSIYESLDKTLCSKLTIISASAGAGKTTSLAGWIESRNLRDSIIWISFDERENNTEAFWACIKAASEKLHQGELFNEDSNLVDTLLFNMGAIEKEIIFVFDNFQYIKNKDIHTGIKHFIDGMGENIHIIISSRTKPDINLARLRLNGELTEIYKNEFNFSYEETYQFYSRNLKEPISEKKSKLLRDCMEGWVAGLQIGLLSIGTSNIAEIEHEFNGENSYIQDYFSEEVMSGISEDEKDFLLKTSVLDELNAEICNAVSMRKNSQQILEQIYDRNLFIDRCDYKGKEFIYHRLFKGFLLSRLKGMNKDEAHDASSRAAKWYEEQGFINSAVKQYIDAGNYSTVIQLIETQCVKKILCNDYFYVMSWMDKIPQDKIIENAKFCIAYMYIYIYDNISYGKYYEFAKKALEECRDEEYRKECLGMLNIVEGDKNLINCEYKKSLSCYEKAGSFVGDSSFFEMIIKLKSGVACFYSGDKECEKDYFNKAMLLSQGNKDSALYLVAARTIVFTKLLRGSLAECENICDICINLNVEDKLKKSSLMACFYIVLALVYFEKNLIDKAEEYVLKGLKFIEDDGEYYNHYYTLFIGYYTYVGILIEKNNKPALEKVYEKIEALEQKHKDNKLSDRYHFHKLKEYLEILKMERFMESGKIGVVEKYIGKRDLKIKEELTLFAQMLIHKEKSDDALMLLNKLLILDKNSINPYLSLKSHILRSQIFSKEDQYENATKDMREALIIGCRHGYVRIFRFKNVKMAKILLKTIKGMKFNQDYYRMSEYLNKVLSLYSTDENVELVSKREKEVLRLIENGAKNSEIAKKLFITESTAKSHILNIFSKLGVHNRVQAIAKAKELGIL